MDRKHERGLIELSFDLMTILLPLVQLMAERFDLTLLVVK